MAEEQQNEEGIWLKYWGKKLKLAKKKLKLAQGS